MEAILIRYGEIALKGNNRASFENKLRDNIKNAVRCRIKKLPGRFIVYPENIKKATEQLKKIFGIVSISIAKEIEVDINEITHECLASADKKAKTFRITVKRSVKKLMPSPELERDIGSYVVEKTKKKVKLKNPDQEISVEISDKAYIFTKKIECAGGLPAGIEGNVLVLVEDLKSMLAGLLAMKRGCRLIPISLKGTDFIDTKLFSQFGVMKTTVIKNIHEAQKIAENYKCRAIVVGQDINDIHDLDIDLPVLRPLVGIDPKKAESMLIK